MAVFVQGRMGPCACGIAGGVDRRAGDVVALVWMGRVTLGGVCAASGVGAVSEAVEILGAGDSGPAAATAVREHAAVDGGEEASFVRVLLAASRTGSAAQAVEAEVAQEAAVAGERTAGVGGVGQPGWVDGEAAVLHGARSRTAPWYVARYPVRQCGAMS